MIKYFLNIVRKEYFVCLEFSKAKIFCINLKDNKIRFIAEIQNKFCWIKKTQLRS